MIVAVAAAIIGATLSALGAEVSGRAAFGLNMQLVLERSESALEAKMEAAFYRVEARRVGSSTADST